MKRIKKVVFGYGRPCRLNLQGRLAFAENGLCCTADNLVPENLNGALTSETHH